MSTSSFAVGSTMISRMILSWPGLMSPVSISVLISLMLSTEKICFRRDHSCRARSMRDVQPGIAVDEVVAGCRGWCRCRRRR